ncbi:hypothetical protein Dsin_005002 [Dipteronia sinensis]|uniref:Uncharacterized protein n=1 Tax=Dipteronia sinensis TaxID=43782 RepID=A0AAE0AWJ2_9ROSI|nr:hypothetical protein Dsin_005002 [Dipteronia sinensis]
MEDLLCTDISIKSRCRILFFLLSYTRKLLQEFQKRKSSIPKPATSYCRKKVEREDLPEDTELYRDPTTTLLLI